METILSARFPINPKSSRNQILEIYADWISKNMHFNDLVGLKSESLIESIKDPKLEFSHCQEGLFLEKLLLDGDHMQGLAINFCHSLRDRGEAIAIKMGYNQKDALSEIGVSLEKASSKRFSRTNLSIKKPILITNLVQKLPLHADDGIPIQVEPHFLQISDHEFIVDYITGKARNTLPIVYLSKTNKEGTTMVNPIVIAKSLSGLAHVFVEPTTSFGNELIKRIPRELACFNGGIRVYWPEGNDRTDRFWIKQEQGSFKQDLSQDILSYIVERTKSMSLGGCTDYSIRSSRASQKFQTRLAELKKQGKEGKDLIELYEVELNQKEGLIRNLEERAGNLELNLAESTEELEILRTNMRTMNEQNISPGEISVSSQDVVLGIQNLLDQSSSMAPYQRIKLERFVSGNTQALEEELRLREQEKREITASFKTYDRMNAHRRQILNTFGYDLTQDGAHYKVFKIDAPQIFMTISKTPGDDRAGGKIVSQFNKTFWKIV